MGAADLIQLTAGMLALIVVDTLAFVLRRQISFVALAIERLLFGKVDASSVHARRHSHDLTDVLRSGCHTLLAIALELGCSDSRTPLRALADGGEALAERFETRLDHDAATLGSGTEAGQRSGTHSALNFGVTPTG